MIFYAADADALRHFLPPAELQPEFSAIFAAAADGHAALLHFRITSAYASFASRHGAAIGIIFLHYASYAD